MRTAVDYHTSSISISGMYNWASALLKKSGSTWPETISNGWNERQLNRSNGRAIQLRSAYSLSYRSYRSLAEEWGLKSRVRGCTVDLQQSPHSESQAESSRGAGGRSDNHMNDCTAGLMITNRRLERVDSCATVAQENVLSWSIYLRTFPGGSFLLPLGL